MTTKLERDKLPKRATVADIAKIIERSEKVVRECIHARGLTKGKDKKYQVAPIIEEHIARQGRNTMIQANGPLSEPTTWSDQLKAKQVEKLQVQIDELKGELLTKDYVREILATHAAAVKGALNNFVQHVGANKRDAELLEWAEAARDAAINGIREAI